MKEFRLDNSNQYPQLTKTCTEQLKGIAIILVVLQHLGTVKFNLPLITYAGRWGVAVFLLLSGYGLAQSYLINGIEKDYFKKRFIKIIPAYFIVTFLWICIDTFLLHKFYTWQTICLALIGFDFSRSVDATMWYITFILLWYVIFYIVFIIPINNILKVALLFVASFIFMFYSQYNFMTQVSDHFMLHSFTFPLGVCIGLYYSKMISFMKDKATISISIIGILSIFSFLITCFLLIIYPKERILFFSNILFAGGCTIFIMLLDYYGIRSKILLFIGSISYEMYLLEWAFIRKYPILSLSSNILLSIFFYLILLMLCSLLLRTLVRKLLT